MKNTTIALLLAICSLIIVNIANANTPYAEKKFYLVDSLELGDLHEVDCMLLDSVLQIYHETKDDTMRLDLLLHIIDDCWSDDILYRYNNYFFEQIKMLENSSRNKNIRRKCEEYTVKYFGNVGYFIEQRGQMDSALSLYQLALEISTASKDTNTMAINHARIGFNYLNKGQTTLALEHYKSALLLLENADNYYIQSKSCKNIGDILVTNQDFEGADDYYKKAIYYAIKDKDYISLGNSYISRAILHYYLNDLDLAKIYCDSSIIAYNQDYYPEGIAHANSQIATLLRNAGKLEEARSYLLESYRIAKELDHPQLKHVCLIDLIYLELLSGNIDKAKEYGVQIEKSMHTTNNKEHKKEALKHLAVIAKVDGDYKNAFKYMVDLNTFKDSIYSDQKQNEAINFKYEFEYEKQKAIDDLKNEQQLALANEQKRRTQLGLLAAALIALIIGIASLIIFNRLKLIRKQKEEIDSAYGKLDEAYAKLEEAKKNELAVSNLKALQSQMNPHFIFNALNSVQDLVLLKDIRSSNKYLGKFSDLIRKILLSSKKQFITLEEEVEILGLYLDLEKLRFGDDFIVDFDVEVSEELQEQIEIPAMFIQPYIENAIKHGLFHKKGEKKLKVAFALVESDVNLKEGLTALQCIIQDNGVGAEKAAELKVKNLHLHTGFSTEAINERIRLLNQTLDNKIKLQVEDLKENGAPKGMRISLIFPIENKNV